MKRILLLILAIALMFTFVACSSTETAKPAKNSEPMPFIWFSDGPEGEIMQSIIDDFSEETGYKVELITVPYKDHESKITTMIQGGTAPALSRVTNTAYFSEFALDLSEVVSTDQFIPAKEKEITNADGNVIAIPVDVTANGIILNKPLAEKYGVNYPKLGEDVWTWDEFMTEMKKFDGDDVVYPGVFDFSAHRYSTVLYTFGTSILSADGSETRVNNAANVEALELFIKLHEDGILDPSVWAGNGDPNTLFRSGKYGFHFAGNWMLGPYEELEFEIAIAPVPVAKNRATVPGGKCFMAYDGSGFEEEAKAFIEFFARPENHDRFNQESLFLSARKGAAIKYSKMNDLLSVFQADIAVAPLEAGTDWANPLKSIYGSELKTSVSEAVMGVKAPQEALDACAKLIDEGR